MISVSSICTGKSGRFRIWLHAACLACIGLALCSARPAYARPEYAQKEGKACQYCHVSPTPGLVDMATGKREPTTRNARGLYYAAHDHSFAGYNERSVMGIDAPPVFHFSWKVTLQDLPRRIAVADVKGDSAARLITLNEKPGDKNASTLTIKKWNGKEFVTEFTTDVQGPADKLEVGKFVGANRPTVIVTSGDLWYWTGAAFAHKPFAQPQNLLGSTRLRDGTERLLIANPHPTDTKSYITAYRIDLNAQADGLLTNGVSVPPADQVSWANLHAAPDVLEQMGIPDQLAIGGIVGLWDARKFGKVFIYHVNMDYDLVKDPDDPNKPKFIPKGNTSSVAFVGNGAVDSSGQVRPYYTPNLAGIVYDIATESPKGDGTPGLLILSSDSPDGKGRSLYFFPLD